MLKKIKSYYSIYPSFLSDKINYHNNYGNKNNIKIKLYNNLFSFNNYSILPIKYCKFRKCYVFDFLKSKYINNKIVNFNFISYNNKIIIDPKYKTILYGVNYVNQKDFKDYKQKYNLKNIYFKHIFDKNKNDESNSSGYKDNESEKEEKKDVNNCLNYHIIYLNKLNNSNECLLSNTLSSSTKDSITLNSPFSRKLKRKRAKSILKNKKGSKSVNKNIENRSINKKVSFGSSQISFYKSQNTK